jgi:hypothetical protein
MKKLKRISRREFFIAGMGIAGGAALSAGGMARGGLPASRRGVGMAGAGLAQAGGPASKSHVVLVRTDSKIGRAHV